MFFHAFVLLAGLSIDRIVGDPDWLWRRLPHPVVGFGKAISIADKALNRPAWSDHQRKIHGVIAIILLLLISLLVGHWLHRLFRHLDLLGFVLESLVVAVFLAQKSSRRSCPARC